MNTNKTFIVIFVVAAFFFTACARQPSSSRSIKIIHNHFENYGKKYPGSIYGKEKINSVEISKQREIRKNLIEIEAFIILTGGDVQRIQVTIEKGPLGWRFLSWENAS